MKVRIHLAAALAVALAACGSNRPADEPPPPTGRNDNLIVPGQRIGKVAVGMPARQLVNAAGSPKDSSRLGKGFVSDFGDGLVAVVNDGDLKVVTIGTSDPWYATPEGIRAGSSELEVVARLGKAQAVSEDRGKPNIKTYCYPGLEIDFWPQQRGVAALRVTSLACREKP